MSETKHVQIYSDGACSGNPGPGGYGTILKCDGKEKELSGGYKNTTNNRMELMAIIKGLQELKSRCDVTVYSDSEYVVNAVNKGWAVKWRANGWMRNKKDRAQNPDLWATLLKLIEAHDAKFVWVKGHSTNKDNARCDQMAVQAIKEAPLEIDEGYKSNAGKLL